MFRCLLHILLYCHVYISKLALFILIDLIFSTYSIFFFFFFFFFVFFCIASDAKLSFASVLKTLTLCNFFFFYYTDLVYDIGFDDIFCIVLRAKYIFMLRCLWLSLSWLSF